MLWKSDSLLPRIFHSRIFQIITVVLLTLLVLIFTQRQEVQAMFGFFKRYDVEMSPPVQGRITDNGKPVAGLQIARSLSYEGYKKGQEQLEHTFTNDNGEFSFPPLTIKSRMPGDIFGQNMLVGQFIYFETNNQINSLWTISKIWDPVKLLSTMLLELNGDINAKEQHYTIDAYKDGGMKRQVIISLCDWEGDHVIYRDDYDSLINFKE